ncbi:MAG: FAD-dependent oxidoreductase, partial [Cyclobacteriaceae bacterium]|nr:FAD-dependent oxidoreductase [Cyclobacteriaceae bacterium]
MKDFIIIGGGIVGLATAYNLLIKKPGTKLVIIEKETNIAQHQTGNNSGVIHSGLYYKPGSLKAINCVNGYKKLIDF